MAIKALRGICDRIVTTDMNKIHKNRPIKRLYSIKDASIYLGQSECAIREMIWAGKMPYIKDGRRILLDINDMNEWIDKNISRYTC